MNDLPFERLRSVPGRKDERIMREVLGAGIKVVMIFLEGGARAPRRVLAAIASDGAA
jgi:hypothetical protein